MPSASADFPAFAALLAILGTLLVGAISPGPSFVMVSRISVTRSRLHGLTAACGMGLGGLLFSTIALAGLTTLLLQVEWLYLILKIAGGAYLIYLGIRIWRGASAPFAADNADTPLATSVRRSFWHAFAVQIANPKTAIVYASVFAALLPRDVPLWMLISLPPLIFCIEAGWYAVVAFVFSARKPQQLYLRGKRSIDRTAGLLLGLLGVRLTAEAVQVSG